MKNRVQSTLRSGAAISALALSAALLAGCASTPESPAGAAATRSNLQALQNDPNLAERARIERRDAEQAVRLAEEPLPASEARLAEHRVYMANQKVEIARAKATAAYTEAQRQRLGEERDAARLASRTEEADRARRGEANLRQRLNEERDAARSARRAEEAERAREEADRARRVEADLQRRIDALQAEATERGIVLTLGDVLFSSGSAQLQLDGYDKLNQLVDFLNQYPDRDVLIEGHTDSVGSAAFNEQLSQRRADSVWAYLARQGIGELRLSARGMGEVQPVATNDTAAGRQQNRRVEIVIENAPQISGLGS